MGFVIKDYVTQSSTEADKIVQQQPQSFVPLSQNIESKPSEINVVGKGGATCTTSDKYTILINTEKQPGEELVYKVTCDRYNSGWLTRNNVTITKLWKPGAYTATVIISDNPNDPNNGKIKETSYTFFKL